MENVAIALLCLTGTVACLGLAYLVFRRAGMTQAAIADPSRTIELPVPVAVSVPVSVDEAPPLVRAEPQTEFLSREEVLAAAQRRALAAAPVPATEMIPREVLLARQGLAAANFEPKLRPNQPPAAPAPVAVGLAVEELELQLHTAERAFARWQRDRESLPLARLAEGPERSLHQALGILAAASDCACVKWLEPMLQLAEVSLGRRQVVALTLLLRNEHHAFRLIDQFVSDQQHTAALREVMSLWRGRETNWRLCEQARRSGNRTFWLDLVDDRRIDPGPELLRELLANDDPQLIVRGLELAKYHDNPEQRHLAMQSHLQAMRHPARRMAAVELGVFDREPAAWMSCRQMANAVEFPRATELIASFGTARDLEPIMRRLGTADGEGLWRLCRSGRKAAAALAARRLQDTRGDERAATALRYVIGDPPSENRSVEALLDHWTERAPGLDSNRRYLYGELFGSTNGIRSCLSSRDDRHHRALGDELFFRSKGKIRWSGRGFAQATLAGVAAVGTPNIDFEMNFGPT
jgi:hypothetical protein